MKNKTFYITLFAYTAVICGAFAVDFPTTTTQQPFSKSGQIQNVQNYSSNPFWSPDAPYNQRMPVPVYVQGTDVDTSDCQRVVSSLITTYCASRNNCLDTSLEDIRPTITVQLASLPNHNFVTPCSGFIDTEFENYKKQNTIAAPTGKAIAFPTATTPNSDLNQQEAKFENPYAPKLPQWNGEPWAEEMQERKKELENLQAQNSYGTNQVVKADFPNTFADLSFTERQEILKQGYEPFKESSAYAELNIKEAVKEEDKKNSSISDLLISNNGNGGKTGTEPVAKEVAGGQQAANTNIDPNEIIEYLKQIFNIQNEKQLKTAIQTELSNLEKNCSNGKFLEDYILEYAPILATPLEYKEEYSLTQDDIKKASADLLSAIPFYTSIAIVDPVRNNQVYCCNVNSYNETNFNCIGRNLGNNDPIFCTFERDYIKNGKKIKSEGDVIVGTVRLCSVAWLEDKFLPYCSSGSTAMCNPDDNGPNPEFWLAPTIEWSANPTDVCWDWKGVDGTLMLYSNSYNNLKRSYPVFFTSSVPKELQESLNSCDNWKQMLTIGIENLT